MQLIYALFFIYFVRQHLSKQDIYLENSAQAMSFISKDGVATELHLNLHLQIKPGMNTLEMHQLFIMIFKTSTPARPVILSSQCYDVPIRGKQLQQLQCPPVIFLKYLLAGGENISWKIHRNPELGWCIIMKFKAIYLLHTTMENIEYIQHRQCTKPSE